MTAIVTQIREYLPAGFENWNPALRGAYLKGRKAYLDGKTLGDCPYEDKRKPSGRISWSRAFMSAWRDGFRDMEQGAKKDELLQME